MARRSSFGPDGADWLFSVDLFDKFRREIESISRWRCSGGVDLLLASARYSAEEARASIEFGNALAMDLELALSDGAIRGVEQWFETVFRFAESEQGADPASHLAKREGVRRTGRGLANSILSLLPGRSGDELKAIPHFVVTDLAL